MRLPRTIAILMSLVLPLAISAQVRNSRNQARISATDPDGIPTTMSSDGEYEDNDTARNNIKNVPHDVYAWKISPRFGDIIKADVDTLFENFQNSNETNGMNGEYNYLGNLGSPRLSRIYINRRNPSDNFFLDPLDFYMKTPGSQLFYNTKSPLTNLSYWFNGNKTTGDDRFKALFTVNSGKRINMGFVFDYLYGRGYYTNQAASFTNGTLFGSYLGDRYQMHIMLSTNHMKMAENGGIEDDLFITKPEEMAQNISSNTIPTVLDQTWSRNDNSMAYLTHRYNIGFHRRNDQDSTVTFVPVTSIIHTFEVNTNNRRFIAYETPENYYLNTFIDTDSINDRTRYLSLKNTFALELKEGFNKWAQAGLTAFVTHKLLRYRLPELNGQVLEDKTWSDNVVTAGGQLSRRLGKRVNYNALVETTLTGDESGDILADISLDMKARILGDTARLEALAKIERSTPTFYLRHYHSKHFWWDNDLEKQTRTRIGGALSWDKTRTRLAVTVENTKNLTYLDCLSTSYTDTDGNVSWLNDVGVRQKADNIQILTAQLSQNFQFGIVHWDNEVTYQTSSDEDVLPLPKVNLYSNLYLKFHLVKDVLKMQIGADVRYFTSYYAPDYSPALGHFYLQNRENRVKIGNYPFCNTYINAQWKRTRIFAMIYYHINEGKGSRQYFMVPHYPVNPMIMKFGISWNFYD